MLLCCLVFVFYSLFSLVSAGNQKMIIVWGKPENSTSFEPFDSWNGCLRACYDSYDCMLVYQVSTGCQLFRFGNVKTVRKLEKADGEVVGFMKTVSSDTCPSSTNPPLFDDASTTELLVLNGTFYRSTVTLSSDLWTFTYTLSECPTGSKLFTRDLVNVCIGVWLFSASTRNHTMASNLCKNNSGTLTGPYNDEEWTLLTAQSSNKVWLDGKSIYVKQEFVMDDDTHNGTIAYNFSKGQPDSDTPGNCLYRRKDDTTDDVECYKQHDGAMCRVEPQETSSY